VGRELITLKILKMEAFPANVSLFVCAYAFSIQQFFFHFQAAAEATQ
jgi:hypothetical protein